MNGGTMHGGGMNGGTMHGGGVNGDRAELRTIRVDEFLPHPPARVWRVLVDPRLLARWLMPNDFRPCLAALASVRYRDIVISP